MDTEVEEVIDFKALRAKFQKSDVIKVKPSGKQASEASGVPHTETVLNVTNVDIFETIRLHNAAAQQLHVKSPHHPLPLAKPALVPKPVLLKLPDWTKPCVSEESGRRPEARITSEGASVEISPNKLQKPGNQTSEPRILEANREDNQLDTISFKEKLNIWENSLRCIEHSAPAEKIKCATLPPSLLSSGSHSFFLSKATYCAEPLFRATSFTQSKKENLSMEPEMQISRARSEILQPKEPTMLIQNSDDSKTIDDCETTVQSLPPKPYLSTPQIDQEGFKLDNNITVESETSPALPDRFIRLDLAHHQEPKFPMDRGEGAAHKKDYQHTFVQYRELPSIEVLGPPPVKPPRPFHVDLRAFQNIKMASCSPMESSKKNGIPSSPISCPEEYKNLSTESTQVETNNKKEQQHREMEQKNKLQNRETKEKPQIQDKERENKEKREKELQRKFNITGLEIPISKVQVQQHLKGGKLGLTAKLGEMVEIIRMVDCPTGKWLAKTQDGNYGYIQIDAVKMDDSEIKEISQRILKQSQTFEEIYDDVGLSEITAEPYSTSLFQSVDCGQPYETKDAKKESERKNSNSANKMNHLTKILYKGKEKKRKGHESPSHILQSEFGPASCIYDDAISNMMGIQKPSFSSSQNHFADDESLHEQVYDDAETRNSETLKGRMKELGKLFKKEVGDGEREKKVKMRKEKGQDHLSANSRPQSTLSLTDSESGTNSLYEDVNNVKEHGGFEDRIPKSDTSKTSWENIFRKREENVKRTGEIITNLEETESNEDGFTADAKVTREKAKRIFKGKRKDLNEEKEMKVDKKKLLKEQEFRENFNYTKEIVVENIAVVEHNAVQEKKGPFYLPIKSGEKLDVIDVGEGNQIICRNAEGKYGYVHVQHLIFGM
ncbi:FYN-binding protein 1 isoform X2 [Carcharodon carcharias]|uniref:FYN-binding protein 1 isoform X2 n=1 Tax=Carcharodon carcharias TaxID=13397 RepID=UPI001B7E4CC1|nr:FYN-binding protein 1 isoform X2 [Carcharodon carcharias]